MKRLEKNSLTLTIHTLLTQTLIVFFDLHNVFISCIKSFTIFCCIALICYTKSETKRTTKELIIYV